MCCLAVRLFFIYILNVPYLHILYDVKNKIDFRRLLKQSLEYY